MLGMNNRRGVMTVRLRGIQTRIYVGREPSDPVKRFRQKYKSYHPVLCRRDGATVGVVVIGHRVFRMALYAASKEETGDDGD